MTPLYGINSRHIICTLSANNKIIESNVWPPIYISSNWKNQNKRKWKVTIHFKMYEDHLEIDLTENKHGTTKTNIGTKLFSFFNVKNLIVITWNSEHLFFVWWRLSCIKTLALACSMTHALWGIQYESWLESVTCATCYMHSLSHKRYPQHPLPDLSSTISW